MICKKNKLTHTRKKKLTHTRQTYQSKYAQMQNLEHNNECIPPKDWMKNTLLSNKLMYMMGSRRRQIENPGKSFLEWGNPQQDTT